MSNETLLYICGITLAVSAVGISFIGLKVKGFPGKAMPLVVIWFAIFVVGSATFAVLYAKDEEAHKAAEFKEAGKKAEEEGGHVAPLGTEGAEGNEEESEAEGEGQPEEGSEEEGAEESPESAEEGAEEAEEGGKAEKGAEAKKGGKAEKGGEAKKGGGAEAGGKAGEGGAAGGEEAGGDPEAGAEVFATNCAACHGEDGHGGPAGPDLTTLPKAQNEPAAIEQVTNGGGGMPPFGGTLSAEEIEDVAAFVVQKVVGK